MPIRILVTVSALILLTGCVEPRGVYHTVSKGQTLYRIALTYDLDEKYLARLNGIDDPTRLRVGERLFIPGADRQRPVPATVSESPPSASPPARPSVNSSNQTASPRPPAAKAAAAAPIPKAVSPAPKAVPAAPKAVPAAPVAKPPRTEAKLKGGMEGKFAWPLQGRIVRPFGTRGSQTCNGVEIAAPEGTPVHAAAAGRVTYSSDGIRGYGNLIIIRHDDSFFTVYGFNQKSLVAAGSFVSRGQKIALSGKSPAGGTPRLHFEIRRGKAAVDPIFYLP